MTQTVVLYGKYGIQWGMPGITATCFTSSGLIQSYDLESGGTEQEIMDVTGSYVDWVGHAQKADLTIDAFVAASTVNATAGFNLPAFGYRMTVSDLNSGSVSSTTYIVKKARVAGKNTEAVRISVQATDYGF